MNNAIALENIDQVLTMKLFPTVKVWNRLEARPRTDNFDRALKAEVRDALWMLTKQWQMGEFEGDDAGSPVFSKIHMGITQITKYLPADQVVQAFDNSVPLEAKVEQRPVPFRMGDQVISLDLRLMMGRQWLKLIAPIGNLKSLYLAIERYKVKLPDPTIKDDAHVTAHKESWQHFNAVSGRSLDGYALYEYLKENPAHHAYDDITLPDPLVQKSAIEAAEVKFQEWYEKLFYQPADPSQNAWIPSRMEYQFACSAPGPDGEKVMTADEYYHGHLDWYNLDIDPAKNTLGDTGVPDSPDTQKPITNTFVPVQVTFDGMPNTRWWTFEEGRTNFGDINPATTDLGKLMFMEFGIVYANDWFLLPITIKAGSIAKVKGMSVTNVFGERFWIEPAGKGLDDDWQRWSMFTLNTKGNLQEPTDTSLLVLPTTPKILEGNPLEEIRFIRDEVANMVWGIEHTVPLASGVGKKGNEAAYELRKRYQKILDEALATGGILPLVPLEPTAPIRYEVMNTVPENWIPLIPVQQEIDGRSVKLQRAAMPRLLNQDPDKPEKIRPRTTLLREGLDVDDCLPFYLDEQEVPKAGATVSMSFQRSRWYNGTVFNWLGVKKQTGRGEGHSGLAFDRLVSTEKK